MPADAERAAERLVEDAREQAYREQREQERERERYVAVGPDGPRHTHADEADAAAADAGEAADELVMRLIFPQVLVDVLLDKGLGPVERRSQCRIDLELRGTPSTDDRVLTLAGRRAGCVNRAVDMLCEHLEEDPVASGLPADKVQHVLKLMLTNDQAGGLIGGRGALIKQMREESGAYIGVEMVGHSSELGSQDDRVVTITGTRQAVVRGHHLIVGKVASMPLERRQPPEPRRLNAGDYGRVDKTQYVDRLPSGAPLRGIAAEPSPWAPPPPVYTPRAVPLSDALASAYAALRPPPPRPHFPPPLPPAGHLPPSGISPGGPIPHGGGVGPPLVPRSDLVLEVSKEFASRIIGPGGGTVKAIRAAAGATIHIDNEPLQHAKGVQLLRLGGPPDALAASVAMINDVLGIAHTPHALSPLNAVTAPPHLEPPPPLPAGPIPPGGQYVPVGGGGRAAPRPGDWECHGCGFHNFASRAACHRCAAPKQAG